MKAYYLPILCLILLQSCAPKDCEKRFAFEFPMSITAQDTFNIGDTIWHEMRLPQKVLDKNSGEYVNIDDFNLYFNLNISRWDSTQIVEGTLNFDIVQDIGTITQTVSGFAYTYLEFKDLTDKHLRFGLVPTVSGKYTEGFSLPIEFQEAEMLSPRDPERFRLTDSPCDQFMTSYSGVRINDGAINYHLIDGICKPSSFSNDTFCMEAYDIVVNRGFYAFVIR